MSISHWQMVTLGSVCDVIPGYAFKSRDLGGEGIPVIKIGDITEKLAVDIDNCDRISEDLLDERLNKFVLEDKDVLLAMTGATAGKIGRVRTTNRALLNQRVAKIKARKANQDYVWFVLSTSTYREAFYNLGRGAAQPNISGGQIESIEIPLPPLATQRRIASILSAYDDLIENNLRRIKLLEEAARVLYKEWFLRLRFPGHEHTRIVNGVPEGWEKRTAFDVMSIQSGGTPSTHVANFWDGEIPFYTPKDYTNCPYVMGTERSITETGLANCNSKLYPKNTVFISARGTVGKITMSQRPMAMSQTSYALTGIDGVPQFFLYCSLQSGLQQFQQRAVGAVFDTIIVHTFKLIPFLLPSRLLVEQFEEFVAPAFQQIENLLLTNARLNKARDILLPKLMSGEVEIDSNQE